MTAQFPGTGPTGGPEAGPQAGPPARPRFEFRPPPSAECHPRPPLLTVSSLLWIAAGGLLLLAVVLPVVGVGVGDLWAEVTTMVGRDFPNESAATKDRAVAVVTVGMVGVGVLLALLQAGASAAMRTGRASARITLALLYPLVALHALLLITVAPPTSAALLAGGVAFGLVGGVLMFLPGVTAWLTAPRRL